MVDLPTTALRAPQNATPAPGVTPGQVAEPYLELADNLNKVGDVLSKDVAVPLARSAGFKAVTRDAEGNLQVGQPPVIGEAAVEFRRASQFSALHQGEAEAKRKDLVLSKQFHNDPEAYLRAAEAFRTEHVLQYQKSIGPEVAASLGRAIDNYTTNNYRSLVLEQQRTIKHNFDRDTKSAITSLDEDIFSLIETGDTGSPTLQGKINERIGLIHERVRSPILAAPAGEAALELKQFDEKVGAAKFVAGINDTLKTKGVTAATASIEQMSADTAISPNQRVLNAVYGQKAIKDHLQNLERQVVFENKIRKQADQSAEDLIIADTASANPQITENEIKTSDMSPEAKMRMLAWKKRDGMPEPLSHVSQANAMDLFRRMNLPDGDPNRITDLRPVRDAYAPAGGGQGKITRQDEEWLERRFLEARTPEGEKLTRVRAQFSKAVEPSIDKSNPLLGKLDQEGKLQAYKFERYVEDRVEEYRAEKKNPHDLFDPTKPDYLGRREIIEQFTIPLKRSIENMGRNLTGRPTTRQVGDTLYHEPPEQPLGRKKGESAADYAKRRGL